MVFLRLFLVFLLPLSRGADFNPPLPHPYYVSVTEISYNEAGKEIQIACKIFTDDFEYALKEMYHTRVDLYHPADKNLINQQIDGYIKKHIYIKTNEEAVRLQFLGYEIEGEAAWCYFSAEGISPVKKIEVFNDLLYAYKKEQVNIMHAKVGGVRKSERLAYPGSRAVFSF